MRWPRIKIHSVFMRVLAGFALIALCFALISGVLSVALTRSYIYRTNREDLSDMAQRVAQMLSAGEDDAPALSPRVLREFELLGDVRLIYVDHTMVARQVPTRRHSHSEQRWDGQAETERAQPPEAPQEDLLYTDLKGSVDEALVRRLLSGEASTDVQTLHLIDAPVMYSGSPVRTPQGEVEGAVILCRPLTEIRTVFFHAARPMLISLFLSLAMALTLAYFVSRRVTRPLIQLNQVARQMADGRYGVLAPVEQSDEIGELGKTLNLLSSRLQSVLGRLTAEKDKLSGILAGIGEGIAAIERDGTVAHVNDAMLDLLGIGSWADDVATDRKGQILDMLHCAMEKEERLEAVWETDRGTLAAVATPFHAAEGAVGGAVCLVRDVSQQARLEQMRRDYIANISHELRTPLTGIRGMVEPLMDGLMETEAEKNACYQVIYRETIRLEKMIGEMLDLSRLQSGHLQMELEPMEPWGLLLAVKRQLRSRAATAGIDLACQTDEENLMVLGNEDRIVQVLIILTDNALSFTPAGGRVLLALRRLGEEAEFSVTDNGCGIDPEDLPYIWERFFKADRSRMRTGGTGLGLPIARLAVEQMHGTISVWSRPGEGSRFSFRLPIFCG